MFLTSEDPRSAEVRNTLKKKEVRNTLNSVKFRPTYLPLLLAFGTSKFCGPDLDGTTSVDVPSGGIHVRLGGIHV